MDVNELADNDAAFFRSYLSANKNVQDYELDTIEGCVKSAIRNAYAQGQHDMLMEIHANADR